MLHWSCSRLEALPARSLYELLKLRSEVFVIEQQCIYLDPDGADLEAWHLQGRDEAGLLQAYARLLPGPRIGRVVTAPSARGAGQGRALMQQALLECAQRWPGQPIELSAQAHLQRFYASLGFAPTSPIYDEDGIAHIDMRKPPA